MSYSRKDASFISCINKLQLQWLSQRHVVMPLLVKGRVRYSHEQLFGLLIIRELRERGFNLDFADHVWKEIGNRPPGGLPWERGLHWLLTDGRTVHFVADPNVVLALLEQRRNPAFFLISLVDIQSRIETGISKLVRRTEVEEPVTRNRTKVPIVEKVRVPKKSLDQYFAEREELRA